MLSLRRRIESLTPKQIVLLVFVIAFLIRLAFLATKPHAFTHQLQAGDEPLYHGLAVNLLKGEGYTFEGEPRSYPAAFLSRIHRYRLLFSGCCSSCSTNSQRFAGKSSVRSHSVVGVFALG